MIITSLKIPAVDSIKLLLSICELAELFGLKFSQKGSPRQPPGVENASLNYSKLVKLNQLKIGWYNRQFLPMDGAVTPLA